MPTPEQNRARSQELEARAFRHLHARRKNEPWVVIDPNDYYTGWVAFARFCGIIPRTGQYGEPEYRHEARCPMTAIIRLVKQIRSDFPLFHMEEEFGERVAAVRLNEERDGTLWMTPNSGAAFMPKLKQMQEWPFQHIERWKEVNIVGIPGGEAGATQFHTVVWKDSECYALVPLSEA